MNKFKWTVEIEVAEVWVADGFDMREGNKETGTAIHAAISSMLPFAYPEEIKVKVKKAPAIFSGRRHNI